MLGRPVIAIFNNEPTFRWTIARLLEARGFEVAPHERDAAAVDHFRETRPLAVILEATYGSAISATSIVERLREHPATRHLPVIVCSPDSRFLNSYGDFLRGKDCVLIGRPFNAEQFVEIVHDVAAVRMPVTDSIIHEVSRDNAR